MFLILYEHRIQVGSRIFLCIISVPFRQNGRGWFTASKNILNIIIINKIILLRRMEIFQGN